MPYDEESGSSTMTTMVRKRYVLGNEVSGPSAHEARNIL